MSQPAPALKEAPAPSGVFISTINALKNGLFLTELDDALRQVVAAVKDTGLKGSIKVSLAVVPNGVGMGDEPIYAIVPDCDPVVPKKPVKGQNFFADEHFNLVRRNPNQMEAPGLSVVETDRPQGVSKAQRAAANS